jgi:hypothetical protein
VVTARLRGDQGMTGYSSGRARCCEWPLPLQQLTVSEGGCCAGHAMRRRSVARGESGVGEAVQLGVLCRAAQEMRVGLAGRSSWARVSKAGAG